MCPGLERVNHKQNLGMRITTRGFTLVELMIVVAIIGVLAALASYGLHRYMLLSKTSEAKQTVSGIARSAIAAYERESSGSQILPDQSLSIIESHTLCGSATNPVPTAGPPPGKKYQPSTKTGEDYDAGDVLNGWKCLKFQVSQPQYYQYFYTRDSGHISNGLPGAPTYSSHSFEAAAQGDLNGNGAYSTFARGGEVRNAKLVTATAIYINDEIELSG